MIGTPEFFPDGGPTVILDGTLARAKAAAGVTNAWKQRPVPTKDEDVPCVLVWHGGDRTEPWGEANTGVPSFIHTLKVIVVVVMSAETPDGLDPTVTAAAERVRVALLTDPTWIGLFEACTKVDVGYAFPGDGNIPYARGLIEFEVTFRSEWPPADPPDFLGMAMTVGTNPKTAFRQSICLPGADA